MNIDEAKRILAACRAGERDAGDPKIAEALELARLDPELAAWFDEEQQVDDAIRRKLGGVPVPEDLLARILDASHPRGSFRSPFRLGLPALAAVLLVLLGIGALWMRFGPGPAKSQATFEAFQLDMSEFLAVFPRLDLETEKVEEVREWLSRRLASVGNPIPGGLKPFPSIGCREVTWMGRRIALACFMVDGEVVHLFVMDTKDWPGAPWPRAARYERLDGMTTAAWTDGDLQYFAMSRGGEALLRNVL